MPKPRLVLGSAAIGLDYGLPRSAGRRANAAGVEQLLRGMNADNCYAVDTAPAYGAAEERLGAGLNRQVPVWTKCQAITSPLIPAQLAETIDHSVTQSLSALRRQHIDLLQWHNWQAQLLTDRVWTQAWRQLHSDQRITQLGCTTYGIDDALAAVRCGQFAWVQVEWNPLRQGVVEAIYAEAQARGVCIAVRSIYLQGVLADIHQPLPAALRALDPARQRLAHIAEDFGLPNLASLCVASARAHPGIDAVLIGARNREEWHLAVTASNCRVDNKGLLQALQKCDRGEDPLVDPRTWPQWAA